MLNEKSEKDKGQKGESSAKNPNKQKNPKEETKEEDPNEQGASRNWDILRLAIIQIVALVVVVYLLIDIWPIRKQWRTPEVIETQIDSVNSKRDVIVDELNALQSEMTVLESAIATADSFRIKDSLEVDKFQKNDTLTKDDSARQEKVKMRYDSLTVAITLWKEERDTVGARIDGLEGEVGIWNDTLDVLHLELISGDPGYEWQKVFGKKLPGEINFILLVFLAGILGSILSCIYEFVKWINQGNRKRIIVWGYILRPLMGGALALVFFFVIHGDLLTTSINGKLINPYGLAGFAAVVGMFARLAIRKLKEILNVLFQKSETNS